MSTLSELLKPIADKIRELTETSDLIKPSSFAEKQVDVYNAGYAKGKAEGGTGDWYNTFWDTFQDGGKRTDYTQAFKNGWSNDNFSPKYPIQPKYANQICMYAKFTDYEKLKLFDFSQCTGSCNEAFAVCSKVKIFPPFDFSKASTITGCFQHCYDVEEIEKIILNNDGTTQTNDVAFGFCRNLKEIRFEGVIGYPLSFANCPLSKESLLNILGCLKDFSETSTTKVLTLGESNLEKLTDAEKAIATEKGWTIV